MKSPQNEEQRQFWEAFRACEEENRVRPERPLFYVKWAQDFAGFLPEMRLVDRSGVERRFSSLVEAIRTETVDTYPKAGSEWI